MSKFPTWDDLFDYHCTLPRVSAGGKKIDNPHYEPMSRRRYNFSPGLDSESFRLVFLKGAANENNRTLFRKGRFIWCKNIQYEGIDHNGCRSISFTVDKGSKRFLVTEPNILCIPSKSYINNNRYFRPREKTFIGFSSVFCFDNIISVMAAHNKMSLLEMKNKIDADSPYRPGTLVAPRRGYFYPVFDPAQRIPDKKSEHPCGIILGRSFATSYDGREFYRVRFGSTTYERVHPIEMEIINEV